VAVPIVHFITHPDVTIDPAVPVPDWPLSPRGRDRMARIPTFPWAREIRVLRCSTERKAVDGAVILSNALELPFRRLKGLRENDRSATGYLPKAEFEAVADRFFAEPTNSVRGWERAVDARRRIVAAVKRVAASAPGEGPIAIVSHGGVGALLLCHLMHRHISREQDQPGNNGGNYFAFDASTWNLHHGWRSIDA
jgi:broad specificity phosphatase PhoE